MKDDYAEMATFAAGLASQAGVHLMKALSETQEVEFKGKGMVDPVTKLDREVEATLQAAILSRFPGHGVLGEEGAAAPAEDMPYLWVLDPIDGTTNFLNGLPLFAISIGVLQEGLPVAAALFLIAGPGGKPGVLHAARGDGAFFRPLGEHGEEHPLAIAPRALPEPSGTVGLPAAWAAMYRVLPPLKGRMGQPRSLGSIAMELAYAAAGLFQYAAFGPARLWDVAAGVLLVQEAGGQVLMRQRRQAWRPIERFETPAGDGSELERLRRWRLGPMIAASAALAWNVTRGLRPRARPLTWLLRLLRERTGR
jgi:myo-inositol-1(or 4)-monophosphatase